MTKIDIVSGFLGAGKTTLIKKLLSEAFQKEKIVIIENEFGQVSIDGGFLKESGVQVNQMNSGCICCSLVGDFSRSLHEVVERFAPERILIEPSGVGKLSDVIKAVKELGDPAIVLNSATVVCDAKKCKVYSKNFGEFFNNQLENAKTVILSRTTGMAHESLEKVIEMVRTFNTKANLITTPWEEIPGSVIVQAMEAEHNLLHTLVEEMEHEHHHHHGEDCDCGCHEHLHHHEHCHSEHDHHHDHHHHHHEHHEHHDHHEHPHGEECGCGCHEHHHHHHADEVFSSWTMETGREFSKDELEEKLAALDQNGYGTILRAKGIVRDQASGWLHFDYVPGEYEVRSGTPEITGALCVIGAQLDQDALKALFS